LVLSLIWVFIAVEILPAYQRIFEDFSMELPELTQVVLKMSNLFYEMSPLLVLAGLVVFVFFLYGARCYVGLGVFDLPVLRRFVRRLDTATILDTLAFSVEASQPIPTAFAALSAEYPRGSIRRRMRRVWLAVAEGREWCDSLVHAGLLTQPDAGVLHSAARAGNLPWAMREVADSNRRRFDCRLQVVTQILFPVTAGAIGVTVCLFVAGCFLPLVKLVECLC
jgi:type II secretory pathway component PulF